MLIIGLVKQVSDKIEPNLVRETERDNHKPPEAAFLLSHVPSGDWQCGFLNLWQNQGGARSIATWRPDIRIVGDTLFMNVEGMLDAKWSGAGAGPVGTATHFKPWVELYIVYANERVEHEKAEELKRSQAADVKRLGALEKLKNA